MQSQNYFLKKKISDPLNALLHLRLHKLIVRYILVWYLCYLWEPYIHRDEIAKLHGYTGYAYMKRKLLFLFSAPIYTNGV